MAIVVIEGEELDDGSDAPDFDDNLFDDECDDADDPESGPCMGRDCINHEPGHQYRDCYTAEMMRDRFRFERKQARNQRRKPISNPWYAAIRRAKRVLRRHGKDHRLTVRAWRRAEATYRRRRRLQTRYFTRPRIDDNIPY